MKFIDKHNCILFGKCKSLFNLYYGIFIKFSPFKQIDDFSIEVAYRKKGKYIKKMHRKYGDCSLENDDIKFVWGIKSGDDLTGSDANLYTMNDIDITYDKKKKRYMLGIETAYVFKTRAAECDYLKKCLNAFTKYMDNNGLKKNRPYILFMSNPCISMVAENIEELYINFKIFVDGFCNQDIDMDKEI